MKRSLFVALLCFFALMATAAHAAPVPRLEQAAAKAKAAYASGEFTFCTRPRKPLGSQAEAMCPLASVVDDCQGFADACATPEEKPDLSWFERLLRALEPFARGLLYVIVAAIILTVAVPLVLALARLRKRRRANDADGAEAQANMAVDVPPRDAPAWADAEEALRLADGHAQRGDLDGALGLYLVASLAALDRRGAIRIARHRTNGEYVRSCSDEEARVPLREIVREVDKSAFGKIPPRQEDVARVAQRATSLVRAVAPLGMILLALAGCGGGASGGKNDPGGVELVREVLQRSGFDASPMSGSLATLPMPSKDEPHRPVVIVDLERVPLEEETSAHLMRWAEAGGALVLVGRVERWPEELGAKYGPTRSGRTTFRTRLSGTDVVVEDLHVAHWDALVWPEAEALAKIGGGMYAGRKRIGEGVVVGVANGDLFTNLGVLAPQDAAGMLAIVGTAAGKIGDEPPIRVQLARTEDGVPPPSNPFAALAAAGLGKAEWHALVAAVLLFLAAGLRQARARPSAAASRRAFVEHVEATGAFYKRAKAAPHALAAYARFVEMRLRERPLGGLSPAAFLAARSGSDPAETARLYERASRARSDHEPEGDELKTIEKLRAMLAKVMSSR